MAGRSLLPVNAYSSLRQIKLIMRMQTYRHRIRLLSGGRRVVRDVAMSIEGEIKSEPMKSLSHLLLASTLAAVLLLVCGPTNAARGRRVAL